MSGTCKTCKHWDRISPPTDARERLDPIVFPQSEEAESWELSLLKMPFEVFACNHPKLTFCERPVERNGFGVADGSEYMATLYTAEDFGCVRWEKSRARKSEGA